jgi:SAM-dependent methyltransferase
MPPAGREVGRSGAGASERRALTKSDSPCSLRAQPEEIHDMSSILAHNQRPAATWGSGGAAYDRISETIADAIEHTVVRLDPKPGERVLDVATGTGWTARRVAARGGSVVGVDIGAELIAAATKLAKAADVQVEFRVGDAERLDFPDGSFDAVVSTFGVMFVQDPAAAAKELARVCRRGGRLALATWPPEGTLDGLFRVMKPYMAPPAGSPPPSPFAWGDRARVRELLGGAFDLRFETGTTTLRLPAGRDVWELFSTGYGPTRSLATSLPLERRDALLREFVAYHDRFRTDLGVAMPREYLVTIGVRK